MPLLKIMIIIIQMVMLIIKIIKNLLIHKPIKFNNHWKITKVMMIMKKKKIKKKILKLIQKTNNKWRKLRAFNKIPI